MTSLSISVLREALPTSWISSQTFQLTTEYYIRSVTQPPPSLLPRVDGEQAMSHGGSWWGGGSSTHQWLFFKITEGSYYTSAHDFLTTIYHNQANVHIISYFFFSSFKLVLAGFLFSAFWYQSRGKGRMCRIIGPSSLSL